jgi:hypothetical protein
MRDLSPEVKTALEEVCSNVFYFYPDSFESLPAISYYDSGNSCEDSRDLLTPVSFHVDVWALTVSALKLLVASADTAMRGLGFRRTFSQPVPETTGYRHQSMIFQGTYNTLDEKLYSR